MELLDVDVEDEDVDVIFEDSVLHQALLDSGIKFLETEAKVKMEDHESQNEQNHSDQEENGNDSQATIHLRSSLLACFVFSSDFLNHLYHQHRYQALQRLMQSRILLPDDRQFLQDFVEEPLQTIKPGEKFSVWTKPVIGFLLLMTVLLNISPAASYVAPALILHLEAYVTLDITPAYHLYLGIAFINFAWCCLILRLTKLVHRRLKRELIECARCQETSLAELDSAAWELLHLERKCLRLLRESELVARGFTLASHRHASSHQGSGQRSSVDQLCPQLRQAMLTHNKDLLAKIRLAVTAMMKSIPMRVSECDFSTVEDPPEVDLVPAQAENSDSIIIPVAPISKSVSLLQIYMSGCMRRLALCFYQRNLRDSTLDCFAATKECVQTCTEAITDALSVLQEHHSFYRAAHRSMTQTNVTRESTAQRLPDQLQNFYVGVNSLDLHLQSVLLMTRELSSDLEMRLDREARARAGEDCGSSAVLTTGQGPASAAVTPPEDWSSWEKMLQRVKTSLDSVQCCYEECIKHFNHRDKALETPSVPSDPPTSSWRETDQAPVKVIPAEDPVIVDQVFEAETEAAGDSDEEDMAEWRRQRQEAAQQRARIQERRETMRHLRQELSAVVGHRAVVHREREERALARARGEVVAGDNTQKADATAQPDQSQSKINGICNPGALGKQDESHLESLHDSKNEIDKQAKGQEKREPTNKAKAQVKFTHINGDTKENAEAKQALKQTQMDRSDTLMKKKGVLVNGRAAEAKKVNGKGILDFKDIVWQKVCADVHQPSVLDLKQVRENRFRMENCKSQNKTNGVGKSGRVGKLCLGLKPDPSICVKVCDVKDSEIVPGIPYSALNGLSNGETSSLDGRMTENGVNEDDLSDSSTVVKKFWKKPAPPRIHKTGGALFVTPVNLITVGYALRGETGEVVKDNDDAEDGEDGGDGAEGGNNGDPAVLDVEVNAVGGAGANADVAAAEGGVGKPENRGEEAEAYGCVAPQEGEAGAGQRDRQNAPVRTRRRCDSSRIRRFCSESKDTGWKTKSEPGARGNKVNEATNERLRKVVRRFDSKSPQLTSFKTFKMINNHRLDRQQKFLDAKIKKFLKRRLENRFLTFTERRTNPFMSPNVYNTGESDDGGPDQDLVGGLRFSPEDPNINVAPKPVATETPERRAGLRAWRQRPLWLERSTQPGGATPMPLPCPMRGVVDGGDVDPWEVELPNRPGHASRHHRSRKAIANARRTFNSLVINMEQASSPEANSSDKAPESQSQSGQLQAPLALSPIPSDDIESFLERLVDPEPDPWVKITHVKMENNNSEVEVIRQKDVDLHAVFALHKAPPPSPHQNSSFTKELAKMAAARAKGSARSGNRKILGAEETFGDYSSDDDKQ